MDSKEIRELIELISRSDFSSFELEREGFKLKLERATAVPGLPAPAPVATVTVPGSLAESAAPAVGGGAEQATAEANGLVPFNSPIIGTFFVAPGPSAPPFVEVGTRVKRGQVICIVEAMKVMNEIESEIDAEIAEIAVADGQPVEYGEVLFRMRPL